jgi:hypothetical protein
MTPEERDVAELKALMRENQRLLMQNNQLLHSLKRQAVWGFWLRIVWYTILIGAPFVLYYFVLEPYFTILGSSFETFQSGLNEIPGWKQFHGSLWGSE